MILTIVVQITVSDSFIIASVLDENYVSLTVLVLIDHLVSNACCHLALAPLID